MFVSDFRKNGSTVISETVMGSAMALHFPMRQLLQRLLLGLIMAHQLAKLVLHLM